MSYLGRSSEFGVRSRYIYTAAGSETSISGADDNNNSLSFTDGAYVDVYLNGVLLVPAVDYNTSTANTIAGLSALSASDVVEIVVYDVFNVADTVPASTGGTFNGNVTATAFYGDGSNLTGIETVTKSATAPTSATQGDLWYDTANDYLKSYDGTNWQLVGEQFEPVVATGGTTNTYLSNGTNYKTHTFTSSGTFTVTTGGNIEVLLVAGGGSGGDSGGGGAGGYVYASTSVVPNSYLITVGAGGASVSGTAQGNNGQNTSAFALNAIGGGGGATYQGNGSSGGSGGGSGSDGTLTGGSGTAGQGNDGGGGTAGSLPWESGGGGGAGAVGGSPNDGTNTSGDGGVGIQIDIDGNNYYWAGGGGGGAQGYDTRGGVAAYAGNGGLGGGGGGGNTYTSSGTAGTGGGSALNSGANGVAVSGATSSQVGGNGGANTGGGGGGAGITVGATGAGGSGIVIIRYVI